MDNYWNAVALDCRDALEWLESNVDLPAGVWMAMHSGLLMHRQLAQRWVSEDCAGWF